MAVFIVLMVLFGFLFSGIWNPRDIDLHEYKKDDSTASAAPSASASGSPSTSPSPSSSKTPAP